MKNLASLNALPGIGGAKRNILLNAFNPSKIQGAHLWWNAANSLNIVESSSLISDWTDEIQGFTVSQSNGPLKPTLTTQDGIQVVSVDVSNDILLNDTDPIPFDGTETMADAFALVWYPSTLPSSNSVIWGVSKSSNPSTDYIQFNSTDYITNNARIRGVSRKNGGVFDQVQGDQNIPKGAFFLNHLRYTGSAWELYLNGVLQSISVVSGGNTGKFISAYSVLDRISIGGLGGAFPHTGGKIGELFMVTDRNISIGELNQLGSYWNDKFGTAIVYS